MLMILNTYSFIPYVEKSWQNSLKIHQKCHEWHRKCHFKSLICYCGDTVTVEGTEEKTVKWLSVDDQYQYLPASFV